MVRPRAWAVLKLMTSSNFMGCSTGQVGGLGAFQDLVDIRGDALMDVSPHRSVRHQPPGARHVPPLVDRRNPSLGRCLNDQLVLAIEARERGDRTASTGVWLRAANVAS